MEHRVKNALTHLLISILLSFVFFGCWMFLLAWPAGRIIHSWPQPNEIDYKSHGPYTLFVREIASDFRLLGGRERRFQVFIGHDENYGHWFDCTFHAHSSDPDEIDAYIRRSKVEWTESGVSIKQERGHAIVFPKETFIGGR
jgi:hypothetical protein